MNTNIKIWIWALTLLLIAAPLGPARSQIALAEIIRAGVKRVIRAVDLKVQRLQNQTIWLQNSQKAIENALSKLKLQEISEWTEKQTKQYQEYYLQFKKVKSAIAGYREMRQIIQLQIKLVGEYQRTWNLLRQDPLFSTGEIRYMESVYSGILDQSISNIDQIGQVVKSFFHQMSDAHRIELILKANQDIQQNFNDLIRFNRQNILLRLQRSRDHQDVESIRKMYNLPEDL